MPGPSDTEESLASRPLYNRHNKFFTARSLAELIDSISDDTEGETKAKLQTELAEVKKLYDGLSETYQEGKKGGTASSSFFK